VLTLDAEVFERLACGRVDPATIVVEGAVSIDGDVELGGRGVDLLNYMF